MRIIAGTAKGRTLAAPAGKATRPMTDRMRESLFSSLGERVVGAAVLDLYAGTGALGLEALSRGAAEAVFVERDRTAVTFLRRNVAAVGLGGRVVAAEVAAFLRACRDEFDLAFVDPPYDASLASLSEELHRVDTVLVDGSCVVVHRRHGDPGPEIPPRWEHHSRRRFGGSELRRYLKEEP